MPFAQGLNQITCEADKYCSQPGESLMVKVNKDTEVEAYYCEYHRAKYIFRMEKMK